MAKLTREQKIEIYIKRNAGSGPMSRKENCLNNSPMENFFGIMKNEMFYGHEDEFEILDQLKTAMEEYIVYYNTKRLSEKLKGLTPVEYRCQSLTKQVI